MPMVDMTKVKSDDSYCRPISCNNAPTVYLNEAQCEALGISSDIKAGSMIGITAIACVTRASQSVESGKEEAEACVSVSLELREMEIGKQRAAGDAAKTLYDKE